MESPVVSEARRKGNQDGVGKADETKKRSRAVDGTYHDMRRMGRLFAVLSLVLLVLTVVMFIADGRREWKTHRKTWDQNVRSWMSDATQRQAAQGLCPVDQVDSDWGSERSPGVEQIVPQGLTRDFYFTRTDRVDRCTTCHRGIDVPIAMRDASERFRVDGGASENDLVQRVIAESSDANLSAAWESVQELTLRLPRSNSRQADDDEDSLFVQFGFSLTQQNPLGDNIPTIDTVRPASPAARAGLETGDRIQSISGAAIESIEDVERVLRKNNASGIVVQRGLPHPYAGHPRIDLFVGEDSPHPLSSFGCTACHDGEGLGTDFVGAAHSPNDLDCKATWTYEYGWTRVDRQEHPMRPTRFMESSCLQCHVNPVEFEVDSEFNDAAPVLAKGYRIVRDYGCTGCHPIDRIDESPFLAGSRKAGPDLRNVGMKFDNTTLQEWTRDPARFHANTKMPKLFGLHEHLGEESKAMAWRLDQAELYSMAAYLIEATGEIEFPNEEGAEYDLNRGPEQIARGRRLYIETGCIACHTLEDIPGSSSTFGPDLSNIGALLDQPTGRNWIPSWLREPVKYGSMSRMAVVRLVSDEEFFESDVWGGEGEPIEDLSAYLLSLNTEEEVDLGPIHVGDFGLPVPGTLEELAEFYNVPIAENDIGRVALERRGCVGCHDIPGFEETPLHRIGPALSGWAEKRESLLAFEAIDRYQPTTPESIEDVEYFQDALLEGRREGFLWQKLREPRSFDFEVADEKSYSAWLMMGRFELTEEQRHSAMTFILGLTTPGSEGGGGAGAGIDAAHTPRLSDTQTDLLQGRELTERFGCVECHMFEPARWTFVYDPEDIPPKVDAPQFDFLRPTFSREEDLRSRVLDRAGQGRATLVGLPAVDPSSGWIQVEGPDGETLYAFMPWEPGLIHGITIPTGLFEYPIPADDLIEASPSHGGAYAELLFRHLSQTEDGGARPELWGATPPPLVGQGERIRSDETRDYLTRPVVIRPTVTARMPLYDLSEKEQDALVRYFDVLAQNDVEEAWDWTPPQRLLAGSSPTEERMSRWSDAYALVTDRVTFCAKCHSIGNYASSGEDSATLAPNLADAGRRLEPEALRRWLADPRSVLPYTAMPINFPPDGPPQGQELLQGESTDQIDAVIDLLINYDRYLEYSLE
jgi:cytochrome c551/c552